MPRRPSTKTTTERRSGRRAAGRSRRRLRLVWLVALLALATYLYYRPLASYVETRRDLSARQAEVAELRAMQAALEQRLVASTSLEATRREARRIGWVRPGEQLFVVKGIPAWRKAQHKVRRDG
jgi:cell division protein FtsB